MEEIADIVRAFRKKSQSADRFDTYLNSLYLVLQKAGIDGFCYWTYDRGQLPTLLDGNAIGTGIVMGIRGPLRLKPLEVLYWRKRWYENDPTIQATEERSSAFRTRDIIPYKEKGLKILEYLDLLDRYGITQDLFVPFHTPGRIQALYFFTLGDSLKSPLTGEQCIKPLTELSFIFGNGIGDFCRKPNKASLRVDLTIREHECLSLTAQGLSTQEIGEALGLTKRTAKFHIENMMHKLDARTRAQAVGRAARSFLLTE